MKAIKKPEGFLIHSIEDIYGVNVLTERIKMRRQSWLEGKIHVSTGRSSAATQSWKETEGENVLIRRGKLFARICEQAPIAIFDNELIVGSQTEYIRGCSPCPDFSLAGCEEVLGGVKEVADSEVIPVVVTDKDIKACEEHVVFWRGKTPEEKVVKAVEQHFNIDWNKLVAQGVCAFRHGASSFVVWHRDADYEKVLNKGLIGIIEEAEERIKALTFENAEDSERWYFLQAAIVALKGMIAYAKRYARLAKELADKEGNSQRKLELEKIAQACEWVPENPARNFHEAVQSVRFIQLGLNLETAGANENLGRVDQYLFPFYERDIMRGKLTLQEAAEILGCFYLKVNEMEALRAGLWRQSGVGAQVDHTTISGVDRDGNDVSNELTYLILKVHEELKINPPLEIRVHKNIPVELMIKGIECNRSVRGGIPAFINDERVILNLVEDGIPIEEARDYITAACLRVNMPHASIAGWGDFYNGPKALELVMYNGWDPRTGTQAGPKTGDPRSFKGIEDWIEAWKKQMEYAINVFHDIGLFAFHIVGREFPLPYLSALNDDCIAKGQDIMRGGARYPQFYLQVYSQVRANTADSLMAIKKLVYEEKKLTVDEIIDACYHNYEGDGRGKIRQMLLAAPKFGNDEQEPDELYKKLSFWLSRLVRTYKNPFGYPQRDQRAGATVHYYEGNFVGALPDGRKAYTPLSDGGVSPTQGADKKGPTAVIRSASKVIDIHTNRCTVLNQRFSPNLVKTKENILKVVDLIKTYFEDYMGWQIQFNILGRETLLAAKANPEEYRDLVIRVGGYSVYFFELPPKMQEEIIARSEQQF